jgi:hypothetical protein
MILFSVLSIPLVRCADAQGNVSDAISKTVNDVLSNSMGGGFQEIIDKLQNSSTSNAKPSDFLDIKPSTIQIIEPSNPSKGNDSVQYTDTSKGNDSVQYTDPSRSSGLLEPQNVDSKPNFTSPNENIVPTGNGTVTNNSQFKPVTNEVTNKAEQFGLGQLFNTFKQFFP